MRILRAIGTSDPKEGGPIEGIVQTSRVLAELGHTTELVCLDRPDKPWLKQFPFPAHGLGVAEDGYRYSPLFVKWIKEHLQNYDAVVAHGVWEYHSLGVSRALQGSDVPYFVYTHGDLDPWFKRKYPLKHLKKSLYWMAVEFHVLSKARAVLFTCEEERVLAAQCFRPFPANTAVVNYGTASPNGCPETCKEEFFGKHPELRGKRMLLFLGRIHPKKGCDLLIEAFAKVAQRDPALHLVLVGPDQAAWQPELSRRAAQLGIEGRMTWPGMLTGNLKWGAIRASEAYVLPSHSENFGIAVVEAMACGVPVLISDKVNIWREIQSSGAGLVASDSVAGTVALFEDWLSLPEAEKRAMGERAEQCFRERFEISKAVTGLLSTLSGARGCLRG